VIKMEWLGARNPLMSVLSGLTGLKERTLLTGGGWVVNTALEPRCERIEFLLSVIDSFKFQKSTLMNIRRTNLVSLQTVGSP